MKLYPVKGIDFENEEVDEKNLYFLKLYGEEKYLDRKDFCLVDNLVDARSKYCTKKEAEKWADEINDNCQQADNDNSRYGRTPDFWLFEVFSL